ncbi:MAG: cobalamin biosynthesis bifunctional protein CbiET [Prochlorococcus sp. SP3034]|nr:cobalamin biosynthesis bifunctional protein CbiET [Prochlorococcus sp. SP3034]|tara:strand:+ start:1871 stop:3148 length:1278 start_codon:yes stop_codon:yes gene_type:complete
MKSVKRKIYIIGINSFNFKDLKFHLRKLFVDTSHIAVPETYIDEIKKWDKDNKKRKTYYPSKSNIELINWLKLQKKDVILISRGDPLWFGIGRILIENFLEEELCFYPGTTCLQLAFSKLKKTWQDASFISVHGREHTKLINALKSRNSNLAIVTDNNNQGIDLIIKNLIELNVDKFYEFWLCEELGFKNEKIRKININKPLPKNISDLNIIILLKKECITKTENLPLFGLKDDNFKSFDDRPNLITKREVRIQILADLELPIEGVLWDIGAGSGTIGLEAIRLRPKIKLFSIDKRLGTKKLIEINSKRLSVKPKEIIEDDINNILKGKLRNNLGIPKRVIIGGCDKTTKISIIKKLSKLGIEGLLIVVPIINIESLQEIKVIFEENNYETSFVMIQVSKGITISEGSRIEPNNPVFILKGKKLN